MGEGSPEILAAYLEVENVMAEALLSEPEESQKAIRQCPQSHLHMFADDALEDFEVLKGVYGGWIQSKGGVGNDLFANLGNTIARRAVYITALTNNGVALQKIILSMNALGVDIILTGLECLPGAWARNTSLGAMSGIMKTYTSLLEISRSPEVRTVALTQLRAVVQNNFKALGITWPSVTAKKFNNMSNFDFLDLGSSVKIDYNTPSLYNSEITMSGFMMLSERSSQMLGNLDSNTYGAHLYTWGHSLCLAGEAANVSKDNYFLTLTN